MDGQQTQTTAQRTATPEISGVPSSNSPALDPAHQHHDAHHSRSDEKGGLEGDVYTKEVSSERSISHDIDPKYANGSQDIEAGEQEKPNKARVFYMRYRREIRIAIHAIILALFTG